MSYSDLEKACPEIIKILIAEGVDQTVDALKLLTEQDLIELGVKKMPAKLFLRKLNEITLPNENPKEPSTKEEPSTKVEPSMKEPSTKEEPSSKEPSTKEEVKDKETMKNNEDEGNQINNEEKKTFCYFFALNKCKNGTNCDYDHKKRNELSNVEESELQEFEQNYKKSKPKNIGVPWSGPCFYFAINKCYKGENCRWEHKNRKDYTQEEEEIFRDPNSNGWKRTYKPKAKPPTPTPTPTTQSSTSEEMMKMMLQLKMIEMMGDKNPPPPTNITITGPTISQTTTQTQTTTSTQVPNWCNWWNGGQWGPWSWGPTHTPRYCVHGSYWSSHCSQGPPKYCRHGKPWGGYCSDTGRNCWDP